MHLGYITLDRQQKQT